MEIYPLSEPRAFFGIRGLSVRAPGLPEACGTLAGVRMSNETLVTVRVDLSDAEVVYLPARSRTFFEPKGSSLTLAECLRDSLAQWLTTLEADPPPVSVTNPTSPAL